MQSLRVCGSNRGFRQVFGGTADSRPLDGVLDFQLRPILRRVNQWAEQLERAISGQVRSYSGKRRLITVLAMVDSAEMCFKFFLGFRQF
jgi:hypothetical protein